MLSTVLYLSTPDQSPHPTRKKPRLQSCNAAIHLTKKKLAHAFDRIVNSRCHIKAPAQQERNLGMLATVCHSPDSNRTETFLRPCCKLAMPYQSGHPACCMNPLSCKRKACPMNLSSGFLARWRVSPAGVQICMFASRSDVAILHTIPLIKKNACSATLFMSCNA